MTNSQVRALRTTAFFQTFRLVALLESVLQVDEVKLFKSSRSRRFRGGTDSTGATPAGRWTNAAKSQWQPCLTQLPHDGRFSSHYEERHDQPEFPRRADGQLTLTLRFLQVLHPDLDLVCF